MKAHTSFATALALLCSVSPAARRYVYVWAEGVYLQARMARLAWASPSFHRPLAASDEPDPAPDRDHAH